MIVSLNWLKKYVDIDLSVAKLVELIDARLVEVDGVTDLNEKYQTAIVVKVVDSEKVPNSDHLSLIKIDDGGYVKGIERESNGLVQVVCGAPNMRRGITAVWLPPESIVPSTYSSSEPFKLGSRLIKGLLSHGMIASAKELDISDEHDGILEINDEIEPGTLFKDVYELDDILLNIDNKPLTHRPDCFGLLGVAREVSAIMGKKFINPDWLEANPVNFGDKKLDLRVKIEDPTISSRYQAVAIGGLKINQLSPLDIQTYLSRSGIRPINLIVDITNYLMLLTGQPLHAFDYDKLLDLCGGDKVSLSIRLAKPGESLELLDGREIKLNDQDIVIVASDKPIALAGAMGGAGTAIDHNTKRIVIESASFNLYNLRSTQMRHGIFSEAITRFTKGQPAELTSPVINRAISMLIEIGGGEVISPIIEDYPVRQKSLAIEISAEDINLIIGHNYQISEIKNTLDNVNFDCQQTDNKLLIKTPYWRTDIETLEDIAEEVGRINGFDNIKCQLPLRQSLATTLSDFDSFRFQIKNNLVRLGANEVLSYSFIHSDLIDKANQDTKNSYRLINSISPSLQYCRQSLTPSLLNIAYINAKAGFDRFAIFEVNKTHDKSKGLTEEGVPIETEALASVITSQNKIGGAAYYLAKSLIDDMAKLSNLNIAFRSLSIDSDCVYVPFEPGRSAIIYNQLSNETIGIIGEYRQSVIRNFKLSPWTAGFELDLLALFKSKEVINNVYRPLSKFPAIERDICFQVDCSIEHSQLDNSLQEIYSNNLGDYIISYQLIDIYKPDKLNHKNVTFRFNIFSYNHTINSSEANEIVKKIGSAVMATTKAKIV